jgi:hypothetical protein
MRNMQACTPSMQTLAFEERNVQTDANEWIVEFSPSDLDSLNRSKQQRAQRSSSQPPVPSSKAESAAPAAPSLSAVPVPPPRTAAAAAGAMANAAKADSTNNNDVSDVATSNLSPTPRRVVGGSRRPSPRKSSNWRAVGPQVVFVILLFVTLGWLATQAWRRMDAHLAPKAPAGILIRPAGAINPAFLGIKKNADQFAFESVARRADTFELGAAS